MKKIKQLLKDYTTDDILEMMGLTPEEALEQLLNLGYILEDAVTAVDETIE